MNKITKLLACSALLFSSLNAEILVRYEGSDGIYAFDKTVIMDTGFFEKTIHLSYEKYMKSQCGGRNFRPITFNLGVRWKDNIVFECIEVKKD